MCEPHEVQRADDDGLVDLLRAGCDAALAEIQHRHGHALRAHARRLLAGSAYDADDAVQDTLLRTWTTLRSQDGETALAPWLHTVLRNRSLDFLRSAANRNVELVDDGAAAPRDAADEVIARDAVRRATRAIVALPESQRAAIAGHALGGETHAQLAARLGISTDAAKALVHRARARLRATAAA